jgi:hypothetical protein
MYSFVAKTAQTLLRLESPDSKFMLALIFNEFTRLPVP